jgi:hypothetical protein
MQEARIAQAKAFIPESLEFPKFWVEHIPFACFLVQELKPTQLVELGTHSGNSFFAFCQSVKANGLNTKCYAVDTWLGDKHSGHYYEEVYEYVTTHCKNKYVDNTVLLRMTFDEAPNRFGNKSIDLLHIDGLHTYEGVKHDFENWLPKLSERAVVLFHDTQIRKKDFGVYRFWEEIKVVYPSFEFRHGCGLGVLAVGTDCPTDILNFIEEANRTNEYALLFKEQGDRIYSIYKQGQKARDLKQLFSLPKRIGRRLKRMIS